MPDGIEAAFDELADMVRRHLDLASISALIGISG
jgi:hypothetical protein